MVLRRNDNWPQLAQNIGKSLLQKSQEMAVRVGTGCRLNRKPDRQSVEIVWQRQVGGKGTGPFMTQASLVLWKLRSGICSDVVRQPLCSLSRCHTAAYWASMSRWFLGEGTVILGDDDSNVFSLDWQHQQAFGSDTQLTDSPFNRTLFACILG